jgi:hypothetical protein
MGQIDRDRKRTPRIVWLALRPLDKDNNDDDGSHRPSDEQRQSDRPPPRLGRAARHAQNLAAGTAAGARDLAASAPATSRALVEGSPSGH